MSQAPCTCCHPADACPACADERPEVPDRTVFVGNELRNRPAPELSPPRVNDDAAKTSATAGAGSLELFPMRAMSAVDAAIVRGDRADLAVLIAAERRAWIRYADGIGRQVIRETAAEMVGGVR